MTTPTKTLQEQICEAGGYTPMPNWIFDEMVSSPIPDSTLRIFLYLYRKTVGWNNRSEAQSLTSIMNATGIRGRNTAVYGVQMLCGCLGLWEKSPGIRGIQNSVFKPTGVLKPDTFRDRMSLTTWIYDSLCPTLEELRDLPPSESLYKEVAAIVASERDYKEKKRIIGLIADVARAQARQERAAKAKHKREAMAARQETSVREADQYAGY